MIYLIIFLLLLGSVTIKLRFNLDISGWITMASYLLVLILSSVIDFFIKDQTIAAAENMCRFVIWTVHAYFIFGMKDVECKLKSSAHQEYKDTMRKYKIFQWLLYILIILYGIVLLYLALTSKSEQPWPLFKIFLGLVVIAKFGIDIILYGLFYSLFCFFFT